MDQSFQVHSCFAVESSNPATLYYFLTNAPFSKVTILFCERTHFHSPSFTPRSYSVMNVITTIAVITIGVLNVSWSACAILDTRPEMLLIEGDNETATPYGGTELPDGIVAISLDEQGGENITSFYDGNNSIFYYYDGNGTVAYNDGNETFVYMMYNDAENGTFHDHGNMEFLPISLENYTILEDDGSNNTTVVPIYYQSPPTTTTTTGGTVVGKMMSGGGGMAMKGGGGMGGGGGGMGGGGGRQMGMGRNLNKMTMTEYDNHRTKRVRGNAM